MTILQCCVGCLGALACLASLRAGGARAALLALNSAIYTLAGTLVVEKGAMPHEWVVLGFGAILVLSALREGGRSGAQDPA